MEFDLILGMAVLERTPATLHAFLRGLDRAWADANEGPETWSPYVIVGHLVLGERNNWVARAQLILAQRPNRRFTPFDRVPQLRDSRSETLEGLLDEFASLRAANLTTVAGWRLTDTELALEGEHPEFGAVTL